MKKFVLALAALSMISTPAFAEHRDNRWGVDSNRNSPYHGRTYDRRDHHRSKCNTGCVIGLLVGGVVIGSAISNSNRQRERVYEREVIVQDPYYYPPVPRQICETIETRDRYGNFLNRQTVCYNQ